MDAFDSLREYICESRRERKRDLQTLNQLESDLYKVRSMLDVSTEKTGSGKNKIRDRS